MIEVEVENFQSILKAGFKIDGFTALVGRSNIGKSALVRALRNALTGASGTDFVRHGASCERRLKDTKKCKCHARVRVVTDKIELVWEKGDAVNRYTVTRPGEPPVLYDKVDRGTPDFLRPDFAPVKVGDGQVLIQVSEQFDPIFLLNKSGATVADVLSDVARLDDINEAMRLVVKDRKEASSTRSVREKDIVELTADLSRYKGLDLLVEDVRRIETKHTAVQNKEREVENVRQLFRTLEGLAYGIRGLQEVLSPPMMTDASGIQAMKDRLQKATKFDLDWGTRTASVERFNGVEAVKVPTVEPLVETHNAFRKVGGWIQKIQVSKGVFEHMKVLDSVKEPNLEGAIKALERFQGIDRLFNRLSLLSSSMGTLQGQLETAQAEETAALKDLRDLGICPTCSQSIDADHTLHMEAV